MNKSPYLIVY